MDNTIHSQGYIFLATVYGGIIIGFLYDLYRIFRYFFKPKKIAAFFEDLIFWIIISLIAVFVLIFSNWGELRAYEFLGFLFGAVLYHKLLSKIVITILVKVVKIIIKILKYLLNTILYPFKIIANILYKPYKKSCREVRNRYVKLKRKAKLPIRIFSDIRKYTRNIIFKK